MESVRVSFLNVICLLNVLYILVKYHENILTCFKVMVCTKFLQFQRLGDITLGSSQLELSFLYRTLTECPLQPDQSFMKIAQIRVLWRYGVHNNALIWTDGWMDGWMDSMLIAISPKPISRRIMKFNKRS